MQYQRQATELLCELGFTTEVNARIAEANGTVHAIDVPSVGNEQEGGIEHKHPRSPLCLRVRAALTLAGAGHWPLGDPGTELDVLHAVRDTSGAFPDHA